MIIRRSGLLAAVAAFSLLIASPASALVIGAGQSVTIDFDFSSVAEQAAIDAASQPLTLSFELTTSGADQFDDPAGILQYQYLDIGPIPAVNFGYDASGGLTSLGVLSLSVTTTDLVGSLRISALTESIDLISATFSAQDFDAVSIIGLTTLNIPEEVDAQISTPSAILIFLAGTIALLRRRAP